MWKVVSKVGVLGVVVLSAACSKQGAGGTKEWEETPGGTASSVMVEGVGEGVEAGGTGLEALRGETPVRMALQGFGPAIVEVPVGAREPRPVVVALHGHSVRPEHACERWRQASREHAFVLCPHGLPIDAKPDQPVTLGSEDYTLREIDAGLEALRKRFGAHVSPGDVVYAGYSLGAKLGASIVRKRPETYRRVALGEGAYAELTRPTLQGYVDSGTQRLLLICSSKACEVTFGRVLRTCDQVGLACRVAPSGENPHMFDGRVVEASREAWGWLVEGSAAWGTMKAGPS
jgi:pimeloyl-ACP methyl ester carboxylesterase